MTSKVPNSIYELVSVEFMVRTLKNTYGSFAFYEAAYRETFADVQANKNFYREVMIEINPIEGPAFKLCPSNTLEALNETLPDITETVWRRIGEALKDTRELEYIFWLKVWILSQAY